MSESGRLVLAACQPMPLAYILHMQCIKLSLGVVAAGLILAPLLGAAENSAQTSEVKLIPRSVLFGNPERTQGRISGDGGAMSFLAPVDDVMNIWLAPAGKLDEARPMTKDTGRGILAHGWAYNNTHILFLKDFGGDENYHVYALDTRTGEQRDLTPIEGVRAVIFAGSWEKPNHFLVGLNDRDPRWHDVWLINVVTGHRELVTENPGYAAYTADRDLNLRLAARPRPDGGNDVLKLTDGKWELFMEIPRDDALTSGPLSFIEGNKQFYMLDSRDRNTAALFLVDLETGEKELVAENEKADVSGIIEDPYTGRALAYSVNYERPEWTALDKSVEKDLQLLKERFPGGFSVSSQSRDNLTWLLGVDDATMPLTYFYYNRETNEITKAFGARPALDDYTLAPMFSTVIKARDGLPLVSYYTLPVGSDKDGDGIPEKPVPLVLDVHGGPWARDEYGFNTYHQWFANRGYAVLNVNYRGSTGFGKDFVNAGDLQWGLAMHDDLLDGVQWAIDKGIADKSKVLIHGGSYGGYAALWGVTNSADVFAGGVSIVGPSNLQTLLSSIPPYWASFFEQFAGRVGDPRTEEGRAILEAASPLNYVDLIEDPLLIGQGANDPRVKQAESDQIVAAMKSKNIPVVYVLFPDEGHGFARPQNRQAFSAISEAFIAQILGGRFEPINNALEGSSTTVPEGANLIPNLEEALKNHEPTIAR